MKKPSDLRLRALWALEGIGKADPALLKTLSADADRNIRRESIRVLGGMSSQVRDAIATLEKRIGDSDPHVRVEVIHAIQRLAREASSADKKTRQTLVALLVRMADPPAANANPAPKEKLAYDREFERYLVRAALETQADALSTFLASDVAKSLPAENRLYAALALPPTDAARRIAEALPTLQRAPNDEELLLLFQNATDSAVGSLLAALFGEASRAASLVEASLRLRDRLNDETVAKFVAPAARAFLNSPGKEGSQLALRAVSAFRLRQLDADVAAFLSRADLKPPLRLAALQALREIQSEQLETLARFAEDSAASGELRDEARLALAVSKHPQAGARLLKTWNDIKIADRPKLAERLAGARPGAQALLAALRSGAVERDDVPLTALEKMRAVLGNDPEMEALWSQFADSLRYVLRLDSGNADYAQTGINLTGPFTVEAWVKLDTGISNEDGILGRPGGADFNFAGTKFRVYGGPGVGDLVIAKKPISADVWTHVAATRDAEGALRIYINGELDATSSARHTGDYTGLNIGQTTPDKGGTAGWLAEFRAWTVARSAEEIRDNFDRSFDGAQRPAELSRAFSACDSWGKLSGNARVEPTLDAPPVLTDAEARELQQKFERFRILASNGGDGERGKVLFATACLTCHAVGGNGGKIAPPLDGVGLSGTEALLRNILTPNAAMEAGYRKFIVETRDGEIEDGFLVEENNDVIVLRAPNSEDRRIPRGNVKRARFSNTSLMPEGLLDALKPEEVSDLFAHLRSLK